MIMRGFKPLHYESRQNAKAGHLYCLLPSLARLGCVCGSRSSCEQEVLVCGMVEVTVADFLSVSARRRLANVNGRKINMTIPRHAHTFLGQGVDWVL